MAANQGHTGAQYNLCILFLNGEGVPRDPVQAYMWCTLAAIAPPQDLDRSMIIHNRDLAAKQMTPAEIARAKKMVSEWKPKQVVGQPRKLKFW